MSDEEKKKGGCCGGWESTRPMIKRQLILCLFLIMVAMSTTSCKYFRLLQLKKQLAEFDHYVVVSDDNGLAFTFLEPVLYSKDVESLFAPPTVKEKRSPEETWSWIFVKQYSDSTTDEGNYDVIFTASFTDDKLSGFVVPQRFLMFMPKTFIEGFVRGFGNAKVNRKERSVSVSFQKKGKEIVFPDRTSLKSILGKPYEINDTDETHIDTYKFESHKVSENEGKTKVELIGIFAF